MTGALIGLLGSSVPLLAALLAAFSFCGWDETCTDDARSSAEVAFFVGLVGALAVMALVYAGVLKLLNQPRPWSVALAAVVLSAGPFAVVPGIWQQNSWSYLYACTFTAAGLVTGYWPRRKTTRGGTT